MIQRLYIFLIALCLSLIGAAQSDAVSNVKVGIKTSINISTLLGSELQNPRPKFGYTAGTYFVYQTKKDWDMYAELVGNFKGSNFKNGDTGYSKIALFYVDAALLPRYKFNDDKNSVSFGPYLSYLGLSSLFVGEQKQAEISDLGFKPIDFGLATYYHIHGKNVSFQIGTKVGIVDANKNIFFDTYFPKTGTGKKVSNLSFEIGMLF